MTLPQRIGEAGYARLEHDLYRTPPWVTEHLLKHVPLEGLTWECAAGEGDMFEALANAGLECVGTDIRGFGAHPETDFLSIETTPLIDRLLREGLCNIVTNPPYGEAQHFIERSLAIAKACRQRRGAGKVAMLLGHDYDTALTARGHLFKHPAFFGTLRLGKRITWLGLEGKSSPRQIHDWFIWDFGKDPAARPVTIYP